MMQALWNRLFPIILILNQQTVTSFLDKEKWGGIALDDFSFMTKKVLFATNGFAND
jgi:hypothetical protein